MLLYYVIEISYDIWIRLFLMFFPIKDAKSVHIVKLIKYLIMPFKKIFMLKYSLVNTNLTRPQNDLFMLKNACKPLRICLR